MARPNRSEVFEPDVTGCYHCFNRVVRRAFLCGLDPVSGNDYSHRKGWFKQRLVHLASYFCIDVLAYAILSNHFHLVVQNRPDQVAAMNDKEVVVAWLHLTASPQRRKKKKTPYKPTEAAIQKELNTPGRVAELRQRLSDPSWLIRMLCQHMGMRCNREDEQTGKFFEARYKMTRLLDEESLLACMAYVDLNPTRAGLAGTLEDYEYVSIADRLRTLDDEPFDAAAWLAPLENKEETNGRTASVVNTMSAEEVQQERERLEQQPQGCLPMSLEEYAELLQWLRAQERPGGDSNIGAAGREYLTRRGIDPAEFAAVVREFPHCFSTAAGCSESLEREARRRGRPRLPNRGCKGLERATCGK